MLNRGGRLARTTLAARFIAVFAALALVAGLAVAAPAPEAYAVTAAEKQAEAQAALETLNSLSADLDAKSDAYFHALAEQEEAQAKMDDAQARIDEANERITELQAHLGSRARSMYRSGSSSMLDLLLGATTFADFATTWDLLNQMNADDAACVEETKTLRTEVQAEYEEYETQEKIAAQKTAEAEAIKKEAEELVAAMQATYDSLSAEAERLLEEERAAEERARAAAAARLIEQQGGSSPSGYSEPEYNAVTGNAVVDRAYSYLGKAEYVWGGCSPGAFDCSGFVSYCLTGRYSRLGTTYTFMNWPRTYDPQPGDVCVNNGHCGIYIGNGQMIHCATYGVGVIIGPVQSGMIFVRY